MTTPGRTFCSFAVDTIVSLLDALQSQFTGLRAAEDLEYLHRTRVATRRLRSALPLFADCFPDGDAKRWNRGISRLTRTLGEARDLDVQMEYLDEELRSAGPKEERGIARLRLRLRQRRDKLQGRIRALLDSDAVKAPLADMAEGLRTAAEREVLGEGERVSFAVCPEEIRRRIAEAVSYDRFVRNPEAVAELHELRKAMKRLRYALEILGPLYDGALDPFIRRAKKMQDLLGSIHDRDVWIDLLPGFLEEERLRLLRFYGHGRSFGALRPGIAGLLEKKKALRSREYALFLDEWDALAKEGFWNDLKTEGETLSPSGERGVGKG